MKAAQSLLVAVPLLALVGCQDRSVTPPDSSIHVRQVIHAPTPVPVAVPPKVDPPPMAETQAKSLPLEEPKELPTPRRPLDEARRLLSDGQNEEALKLAKKVSKENPESFLAWNTLGRAELAMNHGTEAEEAFKKAIEISPSSSHAHNNLGLTMIQKERWEEALSELRSATTLEPVEPYMWNNLGIVLEHLDRIEEARSAYEKGAESGSTNAKASFARLEGVKTIRTAQVTTKSKNPNDESVPKDEPTPGVEGVE